MGSFFFEAAKQEINLLVGVDEEVQKLQGKLGKIKAMLDDAEERHAVKQRNEKLWLEQLQNQYYEMDDILDTWNTARIRAEIEKEEGKPADTNALAAVKKKVWSFVPSPLCWFNPPLRHDVGHMIRKLNEKFDMIVKDKATYGIDFDRQPDVVERPKATSFVDVSEIIGRDIYRDDPLRNLLGVGSLEETNSYRVISLVGMGGIGKTTLAQLAYNHPDVQAHFPKRMWICVSDPFDQCEVAKAIINKIAPGHRSLKYSDLDDLLSEIHNLIREMKYFLVLDDVWTEDSQKWEPFKHALKNGVHGSRILVTTRKHRASEVMGSDLPINLEVLSDEDCWSVLSKIAFSNEEQLRCLEDIGRKLAIKCKGLPLAAKLLGSLMQKNRSREQWNKILDSNLWEVEDIENIQKSILAPLILSYYELTPTMRRCFSFCSVFAKDYFFHKDELVLHWMAQGYVESKTNMEMEDMAEAYFEKLALRSFFQDFKTDEDNDGKIIGCKVHDFAQYMTKNESFEIHGDKKLEINCQSARHLHLEISKEMQHLESIYHAKSLRTLFLLSHERDYEFEMLLSNLFHHFKCLRTLILDCPIKKLPDAVKNLIHLRCLFISKNVEIEELPETFCNQCNLQTLKIENHSYLKKLPQGMGKQINLRHLILNRFHSFNVVFPKGIGKLIGLRTLSVFNIGDENDREGCKLGELKNLNQLRGTLTIYGLENVVNVDEAHNAQLKGKIYLRGLELKFEKPTFYGREERMENDVKLWTALEMPPNLQRLTIWDYQGNTIFPNLGQLPFLEELVIKGLDNVKKVGDEFLGIGDSKNKKDYGIVFPNLKSLKFLYMINWEEWYCYKSNNNATSSVLEN
ncbi:putative disease resistance protein RGA3 [Quercus lobata]|uniref:putative disease resistance protein RGA3 n=1 Tax=Quercus lobata TaxID=97700 RepID=UPI0012458694|nr:putative disease resistance protein RGA3 [Quercus lobata]XP_030966987.1 putative disease resistance protein RGA3 [Quercus lobata]XP_030966988.1 putative disease resistance protein RGA3 [Quercus lobata]XP_030966989.1 putative disease resistance protein RGA3 [Quercus lobata]XP_030966990.1 putative disease resistance protein RGA3 [Quercus lobata]XP_030966991.1 putative disease resistance protein RGA3 [Quercus lobata]XP_030966992.1 putative disease resistance protein RGA3 [Quercus lobata]XP_0